MKSFSVPRLLRGLLLVALLLVALLSVALLAAAPAWAGQVVNLYQTETLVSSQSSRERAQAATDGLYLRYPGITARAGDH